jgi:hypothetical protein
VAIARHAFARAIEGNDPGAIVEAAKEWVAAFADEPHMLPQLRIWLSESGFAHGPPKKKRPAKRAAGAQRAATGTAVAVRSGKSLPRTNGKVDLTRLMLLREGYVEDPDGKLYHPDGYAGSAFGAAS